jgi:hypothetical protein
MVTLFITFGTCPLHPKPAGRWGPAAGWPGGSFVFFDEEPAASITQAAAYGGMLKIGFSKEFPFVGSRPR